MSYIPQKAPVDAPAPFVPFSYGISVGSSPPRKCTETRKTTLGNKPASAAPNTNTRLARTVTKDSIEKEPAAVQSQIIADRTCD